MLKFLGLLLFSCCALFAGAQNVVTDGTADLDRPTVENGGAIDDKMKPVQSTAPAAGAHSVAVQGTLGDDKMKPVQSNALNLNRTQVNTTIPSTQDVDFDKNKPSTRIKP